MRSKKNPWILIVLLFACALIGGIIGEFLFQYPFFSFIGFGGTNGYKELFAFTLNPAINAHIIKFGFNIAININLGSIIGMILGILIYAKN